MARYGIVFLRVSLGIVYFWFGVLKFFPDFSPAMELATRTITPIFFFPQEVFTRVPYALTLEGQYIVKNLVIISAGLVIGATVRGGGVVADPEIARKAKEKE